MCGTSEWEWEENRRAYAPVEKFCHGCYMKHVMHEDSGSLPGTTIALLPTDSLANLKRLTALKREQEERRHRDGDE